MSIDQTEIRVKGKSVWVSSALIEGRIVTTTDRWLKIAALQDEHLVSR